MSREDSVDPKDLSEHGRRLVAAFESDHGPIPFEDVAAVDSQWPLDPERVTERLAAIPGAHERTLEGIEQARRGEVVPLSKLI